MFLNKIWKITFMQGWVHVLDVLAWSGSSIITRYLRNTNIFAHKYSSKKINFKHILKKIKLNISFIRWWVYVLDVLDRSGASTITCYLWNTQSTLKIYFWKMNLKDYHYTMMHVCFERPSTIRGFNNLSLAKKTHILAHQ